MRSQPCLNPRSMRAQPANSREMSRPVRFSETSLVAVSATVWCEVWLEQVGNMRSEYASLGRQWGFVALKGRGVDNLWSPIKLLMSNPEVTCDSMYPSRMTDQPLDNHYA